jgi:hypothetical protein
MIRRLFVLAAAAMLVGCTPTAVANAALGSNTAVQDKFFQGLRDTFTKNGMNATQTECIVNNVKSQMTQADFDGILKEDAATMTRLGELGANAATKCLTP